MLTALLSLTALTGTTAYALVVPRRHALGLLLAASGAWLLANGPLEGPILWVLDSQHGLTTADLLAPVALGAVGLRLAAARRPEVVRARR